MGRAGRVFFSNFRLFWTRWRLCRVKRRFTPTYAPFGAASRMISKKGVEAGGGRCRQRSCHTAVPVQGFRSAVATELVHDQQWRSFRR